METVASRTYKVARGEFPLHIVIAPKNTTGNRATTVIIGHIREVKNGVEVNERDANVTEAQRVIDYEVPAPQSSGRVDVVQTMLGFFANTENDNARFEITITTSRGDQARTSIRNPTFNPGVATLTLQA